MRGERGAYVVFFIPLDAGLIAVDEPWDSTFLPQLVAPEPASEAASLLNEPGGFCRELSVVLRVFAQWRVQKGELKVLFFEFMRRRAQLGRSNPQKIEKKKIAVCKGTRRCGCGGCAVGHAFSLDACRDRKRTRVARE